MHSTTQRLLRFAAVGVASTALYLVVYVIIRTWIAAQPANLIALLVSAVMNTALNRRVTFGLAGRTSARTHAQGLLVFALGAALTSLSLLVLHANDRHPGRLLEVAVLLAATVVATLVRYALFSRWIFRAEIESGSSSS